MRNRCRRAHASERSVEAVAEVVDPTTNVKRKVSFLPSWLRRTGVGRGDDGVLHVSPDDRVAIVGEPSRESPWILARETEGPPRGEQPRSASARRVVR